MTGLSQAGWLARALWIESFIFEVAWEVGEWTARIDAAKRWEEMWEVNY